MLGASYRHPCDVDRKGVGNVRVVLTVMVMTGLALLSCPLAFAESPPSCGIFCAVYESYCLGPDDAVQSSLECPHVPPSGPGTEREVISCAFIADDTTLEGVCGWSRLGDYESSDCGDDSFFPVEPTPCDATDWQGEAVSGVCEGGCEESDWQASDGASAGGCQAAVASPFVALLWLIPVLLRRRR